MTARPTIFQNGVRNKNPFQKSQFGLLRTRGKIRSQKVARAAPYHEKKSFFPSKKIQYKSNLLQDPHRMSPKSSWRILWTNSRAKSFSGDERWDFFHMERRNSTLAIFVNGENLRNVKKLIWSVEKPLSEVSF